jgi:outer membrane protein assembly factor BamB
VLVGEYLYGSSGVTLVCAEFKTGQIKWSERVPAPGALGYADGRLYFRGDNGTILLVEATPEGYREHGRFTPPNPPAPANQMEKAWPHPVIADGRVFVRDGESLWCYDIKDEAESAK